MPFNFLGPKKIKAECWFCQHVNHLEPLNVPKATIWGKQNEPLFALEGSKNNFHCASCGNWNLRDANGNIVSNLPAMHNPLLNSSSSSIVSRPGSTSGSGSTHVTAKSPLCDRCRTNQVLVMNYKANYFPEDDKDPRMQRLEQSYHEDVASFERSFPPLCEKCEPKVEDIIKKKDYEAQVEAWKMILHDAGQAPETEAKGPLSKTDNRYSRRNITAAWIIVTLAYPPFRLISGFDSICLDLLWMFAPFWLDPLPSLFWNRIDPGAQAKIYSSVLRYSHSTFGLSSILLHGWRQTIFGSLCVLASYIATVSLLLTVRASAKAERLRLARQNSRHSEPKSAYRALDWRDFSQRPRRPSDPFNLVSLINNVTSTHSVKTASAPDPHQPRSSPAIQLSPSPEIEPLPPLSILPDLRNDLDPDSMDWEATEPVIDPANNAGGSPKPPTSTESIWDRFAVTKQRIFVKDQLTGLERAFEKWRDLGGNVDTEPARRNPAAARVFPGVYTRRTKAERAAYMLASVLRILSLSLTWPTKAREHLANIDRVNGTGFGIAASFLEAGVSGPQIVSLQMGVQSATSIIRMGFAFVYVITHLPAVQIVLGQNVFTNQNRLIDAAMAVLDLVTWALL